MGEYYDGVNLSRGFHDFSLAAPPARPNAISLVGYCIGERRWRRQWKVVEPSRGIDYVIIFPHFLAIAFASSSTKKMDYRWQNGIIWSTSHKAFANSSNHNLFLMFSDKRQIKLSGFKFSSLSGKIHEFSMTFSASSQFHDTPRFSRFPDGIATMWFYGISNFFEKCLW